MSNSNATKLYVEIGEQALALARVQGEGAARKLSFWGEAARSNKEGLGSTLAAAGLADLEKPEKATILFRPDGRTFHLSTAEEAERRANAEAVKAFFNESPLSGFELCEVATVYAKGGANVEGKGGSPWLAAGIPQEGAAAAIDALGEWNIKPGRIECATFAWLGGCQAILEAAPEAPSVAVLDLGAKSSTLFVVNGSGVIAARTVAVGFDHVAEVIHAELKLKFFGAATRLFFNDKYDFSRVSGLIAENVANALAPEMKDLVGSDGKSPENFALAGLPSAQAWLGHAVAGALEIPEWRPDIGAWLDSGTVKWSARGQPGDLDVGVLGLLNVATSHPYEKDEARVWRARWFGTDIRQKVDEAAAEAGEDTGADAEEEPKPVAMTRPTEGFSMASAVLQGRGRANRRIPRPLSSKSDEVGTQPIARSADSIPAKAKRKAQSSDELSADSLSAPVKSASRKGRSAFAWVSMALVIAGMAGFGWYYFQVVEQQRVDAELQVATATKAQLEAEEQTVREAQARREAEEQAAREAAEAVEARHLAKEAQRERHDDKTRLLKARGAAVIVTEPAGATVRIGNLTPQETPARFRDMRLGQYKALIVLEGYESKEIDVEITEDGVFQPDLLKLRAMLGAIRIVTKPAGATFDIRPSTARLFVGTEETFQGETPGIIDGLAPGEYVVTLFRDGWPKYSETVVVGALRATEIRHEYVGAEVRVTSQPEGAAVFVDGAEVGKTPLSIPNIPPGQIVCSFSLDGFVSRTISEPVAESGPTEVSVKLHSESLLTSVDELDELPEPIAMVHPKKPRFDGGVGGKVVIQLVVDDEGYPGDMFVEASFDDVATKVCMEALARWRFKPGIRDGRPVRTRVAIPFMMR